MILSEEACKLALVQRTCLQRTVESEYERLYNIDFYSIKPYLPDKCESILDIGCGIGGLDILLYRHYGRVRLHLLDGETTKGRRYGYGEEAAFYNSMKETVKTLTANGVKAEDIYIGAPDRVDLIVSLRACGYHWPVSLPCEANRVILDLRKEAGQRTEGDIVIEEDYKRLRVCR